MSGERTVTVPRIAALAVLVVAAAAVVLVLLRDDADYRVTAELVTASQLVEGNEVKVGGEPVGTVEAIALTDDSRARITMALDEAFAPLRRGTRAIVRQESLSGQVNRYVDLQLGGADRPEIPDGGRVPASDTQAAVDLDELFNTFDPATREGTRGTIRLLRDFTAGRADEAQAAARLLSPALASSSRLFAELEGDRAQFGRFIVENSRLVTDLAARDEELAGIVRDLATTMDALAAERGDLGRAVETLPAFLRRANSTFVNLRGALDDLDPLVAEATPVVREDLRPLLAQLRPFARGAVPTVRDLSRTIRRPGAGNDLVELLRRVPAVDRVATRTAERNGERRPGALPAIAAAMPDAARQLVPLRAYAPELVGWMDDFAHTGVYDALGGISRSNLTFSSFARVPGGAGTADALVPVPPDLRDEVLAATTVAGRNDRCPGALERPAPDGSNPWKPSPAFDCDLGQVPPGR